MVSEELFFNLGSKWQLLSAKFDGGWNIMSHPNCCRRMTVIRAMCEKSLMENVENFVFGSESSVIFDVNALSDDDKVKQAVEFADCANCTYWQLPKFQPSSLRIN